MLFQHRISSSDKQMLHFQTIINVFLIKITLDLRKVYIKAGTHLLHILLNSMKVYIFLLISIVFDAIAIFILKFEDTYSKWITFSAVGLLLIASYFCLTYPLRILPISLVSAIWYGGGIISFLIMDFIFCKKDLDVPAIIGLSYCFRNCYCQHLF